MLVACIGLAGTNAHRFKLAGQEELSVEEFVAQEGGASTYHATKAETIPCGCEADRAAGRPGETSDPAAEDLRIQLFRQYLIAEEDEGFEGSFADFAGEDLAAELQLQEEEAEPEPEEVSCRSFDAVSALHTPRFML